MVLDAYFFNNDSFLMGIQFYCVSKLNKKEAIFQKKTPKSFRSFQLGFIFFYFLTKGGNNLLETSPKPIRTSSFLQKPFMITVS